MNCESIQEILRHSISESGGTSELLDEPQHSAFPPRCQPGRHAETDEEPWVSSAARGSRPNARFEIETDKAAAGLGQLVMTLVNLLHELLERQAIRRMDAGTLTEEQIERLGECLMKQSQAIDQLCDSLGLKRDDLNIDLGPLGRLV